MFLNMKNIMTLFVAIVLTTTTLSSCYTTSEAVASSVEAVDDIYAGTNID